MKSLVIVESPAKAKTINKILGKDYHVTACYGHIRDLPEKELGVDLKNGFEPKYETTSSRSKVVKELSSLAKDSQQVYLATDPDREGEAICWHLAELLRKRNGTIRRILFNEITPQAVRQAIQHPMEINQNLVNAQQARRILDRLVGYKISPLLWRRVKGSSSAGRVQSVALRLICEREQEIRAFVPIEYWTIEGLFEDEKKISLKAGLYSVDGQKVLRGESEEKANGEKENGLRIENEAQAKELLEAITSAKYHIASIEQKPKTRRPSPPYITSTLQQDAARKLGYTGDRTMKIAQTLYEGVDIDDETVGLITYMRTDSTRIAEDALNSVRTFIDQSYGKDYLPGSPTIYKVSKAAQDAHEAIRPTQVERTPESLKKYLTRDQLKLYQLIWRRYVACQMTPARYRTTTIEIKDNRFVFRAVGSVLEFDGFTRVYQLEDDKDQSLPALSEGEKLNLLEVEKNQHFTRPPARYNDASLIKELEERGIGRPSTYASIVKTIVDRKYVAREEKRFRPTELGELLNQILIDNFPNIMDVGFTAHVEEQLDKIEEGQEDWKKILKDFYDPFEETLKKAESGITSSLRDMEEVSEETCGNCGKQLVKKWGRNGWFLACPGYPECKFTKNLSENEVEKTDEKCPECGEPMVIKTGRTGRFLACSGYPNCKNTQPLSIGVRCPKEGCTGNVVERRSKRGKVFFGCSRYPQCDFVSWYRPINEKCPVCGSSYLFFKVTKRDGPHKQCPDKNCKYKEQVEEDSEVAG